jgi:hypothetical protein
VTRYDIAQGRHLVCEVCGSQKDAVELYQRVTEETPEGRIIYNQFPLLTCKPCKDQDQKYYRELWEHEMKPSLPCYEKLVGE